MNTNKRRALTNTEENSEITLECAFCNTSPPTIPLSSIVLLLLPVFFFCIHLLVCLSVCQLQPHICSFLLSVTVCLFVCVCDCALCSYFIHCARFFPSMCTKSIATSLPVCSSVCLSVCVCTFVHYYHEFAYHFISVSVSLAHTNSLSSSSSSFLCFLVNFRAQAFAMFTIFTVCMCKRVAFYFLTRFSIDLGK